MNETLSKIDPDKVISPLTPVSTEEDEVMPSPEVLEKLHQGPSQTPLTREAQVNRGKEKGGRGKRSKIPVPKVAKLNKLAETVRPTMGGDPTLKKGSNKNGH